MQRFMDTKTFLPRLALVLMLALSTASCSTTRVQSSSVRDSVVVKHDTVFTSRFLYDSTYIDRWHTMIANDSVVFVHDSIVQYKCRTKHDSIYINKTDTVYVKRNVTKTKLVPRKRTWFDWLSYAALAVLLLLLATKAKRFFTHSLTH